ncbi:MAG: universal stress protein [Gemmataceae bacterium]
MIDLRRVLVPTDFSKHSETALTYGGTFAERFGAELHLLHVQQDLAIVVPDVISALPPPMPARDDLIATVVAAFNRLVHMHALEKLTVVKEVRFGTPYHEIVEYARESNIDLIVMGTHGHGGLVHLLLGSVTEKVVRKSPCPVLTVRNPEHEFVHP